MQIVRLEARTVRIDLVKPYLTADYKGTGIAGKACVILQLVTDTGLVGWGESDPFPTFTYESPEGVMAIVRHHLGPAILGLDPRNLIGLHEKMDVTVPGWPFAKAPIDVAAHDLLGQALGVPVYQLLGGLVRDRIPMIWPIGGAEPAVNATEAATAVSNGYRSLHIKLGALAPETDVARVRAIREAVGADIPLMLDVNQGWDRATALRTIPQLEPFGLSMIEQPVPAWDAEGMALVQAAFNTPISADESLHSTQQAMDLVRHDGARVFSLKTGKLGGLFRARQVAALAEAAGIPCFVNSMIEMGISVIASLHLAATIPNLVGHGHALMSNLRITEDILAEGCLQYNGKDILVPAPTPGLGVQINEEVLARRTIEHFALEM